MYTQCPECLAVYAVEAEVLGRSLGRLRCGHCGADFDALHTLAAELPATPFRYLPTHAPAAEPPRLGAPVHLPDPRQPALAFPGGEASPRHEPVPEAPEFLLGRPAPPRGPQWPWALGALALALVFLVQIAWAERDDLLANATLRPWLDRACVALGCRLPLRHDVRRLELLARDIRPHPSVPGALIISATVRNAADFPQAWPVIEISLADLDENRIAMRRFLPREYIGDARVPVEGIAPGASASVAIEVQDPGKNAVAFEFKFL